MFFSNRNSVDEDDPSSFEAELALMDVIENDFKDEMDMPDTPHTQKGVD